MIKKIFYILGFNLIFIFNVFALETITIDIGDDKNVTSGDTVNVVATIGGDCSNLSLSTVYFMEQNDKGDWSTKQSGGVSDNTYSFVATQTKQIKAQIRCPQGVGPIFASEIISEDIITVNVGERKSSGKSRSTKMREEAENLFYDTGSIEKINLELGYRIEDYSPFLYLYWNNIGADGQITYDLEYSTGSTFQNYITLTTREEFYNFFKNELISGNYIHYFRVKASYLGKYSKYSNILKYYSEDYLKISCLNNKKYINFEDVFLSYDLLINSNLKIDCRKCNLDYKEENEVKGLNIVIDKYYNIQCKKCK